MRLLQKELLLYNDSFDKWGVIETKANSWNSVLSYTMSSSSNWILFCVGTAGGEVLLSEYGQDYLLKQPKIKGTDTLFTDGIFKIAQSDNYKNCFLIITSENEIYFSDDYLETVAKQNVPSGTYLDVTYCYDRFWIVGENGFYARASIIGPNQQHYNLSWEQPTSFTSRNIHKIKYLNYVGAGLIALDYAYTQGMTFVNRVYKYSASSGWNLIYQEITASTGWKLIVDVTVKGNNLIAIRSDDKLNLHNITTNTALVFDDIEIEGSGITKCGDYNIACGKNGKIVVSDDLENWKEFVIEDPEGQELYLEYIASNIGTDDIVAMDSNYLVHINKKLLDKLMEL